MSIPSMNPAGSFSPAAGTATPHPSFPATAGTRPAAGQPASATTAPPPASTPDSATAPVDMQEIRAALAEVQQTLAPVARNLLFSLDEDSGKTIITVVDSSTDEVIRQIPSEELVAISKALGKLQGLLIKQEA